MPIDRQILCDELPVVPGCAFLDHRAVALARIALLSITFALALPLLASADELVVKVPDLHGDWFLYAGDKALGKITQWQELAPGGTVRVKAPSSRDYIVITDAAGRVLLERRCSDL